MPGNALGDAIGITWMLRRRGEVLLVQHGGTTIGQHSAFVLVPEHDFAIAVLTNSAPSGDQLNTELVDWALGNYLGVVEPEPDLREVTHDDLAEYVGDYDAIALSVRINPRLPNLVVELSIKPEMLAEVGEVDQHEEPVVIGLVADGPDHYVVTEGAMKGMRGYFTRDGHGRVDSVNLGGRRCDRLPTV
jgi:hypothetical protein